MSCMGALFSTGEIVAISAPPSEKTGCVRVPLYPCRQARRLKIGPAPRVLSWNEMSTPDAEKPFNLLGKSPDELRNFMQLLGEPAYRGGQIYRALYAERRFDVASMTNLPLPLRERLRGESSIVLPEVRRRYSSSDGAVRYVLALDAAEAPAG